MSKTLVGYSVIGCILLIDNDPVGIIKWVNNGNLTIFNGVNISHISEKELSKCKDIRFLDRQLCNFILKGEVL